MSFLLVQFIFLPMQIFPTLAFHFHNYANHSHTYEIWYTITEIEFMFNKIIIPADENNLKKHEF